MPYLLLEAIKSTVLGKAAAVEISGTDLVKNEQWSKKFFKNKTDLVEQLQDFEPGDEVNVVMEQDPANSKWWNIKSFEAMTDDDRAKIEAKKKFGTKAPAGGGGGASTGSVRRSDGGSRGDDTNRASAIYLAREIVNMCGVSGYNADPTTVALEVVRLSDEIIYPYIKDGAVAMLTDQEATTPAAVAEPAAPRRRMTTPKV